MKTVIPLDLESLVPTESFFRVSGFPEEIKLKKWTLKVKADAIKRFGELELGKIFTTQNVVGMAGVVYFCMMFPSTRDKFEAVATAAKENPDNEIEDGFDAFLAAIESAKDQATMVKALCATVGIGEPELKKVEAALKSEINKGSPHAIVDGEIPDPNGPGLNQ